MKNFLCQLAVICISGYFSSCSDEKIVSPPDPNRDQYLGDCREFTFGIETESFEQEDFVLHILAPNGEKITRKGIHNRENGISTLVLDNGLCDNNYRLLFLEHETISPKENKTVTATYGLGCMVEIRENQATITDCYSPTLHMFYTTDSNTSSKIYSVSDDSQLHELAKAVNTEDSEITSDMVFRQTNDIDLELISYKIDKNYGWNPIGSSNTTPFIATYDGGGHTITGLDINRPRTCGVGLFGFTHAACIKNVNITDAQVHGDLATGGLIGAVITSGNLKACTVIDSCSISNSTIGGVVTDAGERGVDIGGLVGTVDEFALISVTTSSSSGNTISAAYNAGGLVGGGCHYSNMVIGNCTSKNSTITAQYSGAGGIVATADSIYISGCTNSSAITGGIASDMPGIGTGGIIGGSGGSYIADCINTGNITGDEGTGGIIGSTRIKGSADEENPDAFMYNYTVVKYCGNSGEVKGNIAVGGICGDSNFGSYGVYNTGTISGNAQVGGILGASSIAVVHNAVNSGAITVGNLDGGSYCGGIIGKADISSIALNQNNGKVSSAGTHTAGIIGLSGSSTVIHQCSNFGEITSSADGATGGIVGELGDPREWSGINIAEVVVGSFEIAMAAVGPVLSYIGHTAGGAWHIILELTEVGVEIGFFGPVNSYLLYHSAHTIIHAEELEEINTVITSTATNIGNDVSSTIATIRSEINPDVNGFNKSVIPDYYSTTITETLSFYTGDSGAETYNKNINDKRNEMSEEIEASNESQEITQTVIAGIALAASIVTTIGAVASSFITGGATATVAFVAAGSIVSIVSGINAIVKGSTDFADNAVIISQCVNSANVSSGASSETGGLVGILNDHGILRDCLNTGNGNGSGGAFVGTAGSKSEITRCLSLGDFSTWREVVASSKATTSFSDCYYFNDDASAEGTFLATRLTSSEVSNPEQYTDWNIASGDNISSSKNTWFIPTEGSNAFPIPNFSEMR